MTVENKQSGPEVAQQVAQQRGKTVKRVGKTHSDYWMARLVKRTYERDSKVIEIPEWHIRIKHLGKREWFNTGTPNKAAAASKARDIYISLLGTGWEETKKKFKPDMVITAGGTTVGDYLRAVEATGQIRQRTFLNYQNCFRTVLSEIFGIKSDKSRFDYRSADSGQRKWAERIDNIQLEKVTPDRIKDWQKERVKAAGHSHIAIASAQRTCNSYIRCARSLFSKNILKQKEFKDAKLPAVLPFSDVELFKQGSMKYVSKINAQTLIAAAKAELRGQDPEAYKIFLLGLFAGLRKSEIDSAEWRMIDWQKHVLHLKKTEWLHLKTDSSEGDITIDPEVAEELREFMPSSKSAFIVTSDRPPRNDSARAYYRCEPIFDRLNEWLRGKGIKANKPLHELRKEVGALITTEHGIFAAMNFLRHSDITTTARHYAEHKGRISVGLGKLLDTEIKSVAAS